MNSTSVFLPPALIDRAQANIRKDEWAAGLRDRAVAAARPWMALGDDALWALMFGNTLRRSWMVWSNGHCPACRRDVPMYTWIIDAFRQPWKARCPHCAALFPTNDFAAFYQSGLDARGVFDPARADRALLFNTDHPDPADPLRDFGVDDGNGYAAGGHRWWFIATYLIYGQWKQAVWGGIRALSAAYALTGNAACAHKAGVLLHRVADLYPAFDFKTEGVMYEGPAHAGYVSTWHDACEEARELALAYDRVRPALLDDQALADFLAARAAPGRDAGAGGEAVCRHIEQGILRDTLAHLHKIQSNYPRTEVAQAMLMAVLDWPGNRDAVMALVDGVIAQATAVDGVTGEKGLAAYASYTLQGLAVLLGAFDRLEPGFLDRALERHPALRQTYRFHIDTWCWQRVRGADRRLKTIAYYPQAGDSQGFAEKSDQYVGVLFLKDQGLDPEGHTFSLAPSGFTFLWRLWQATGDTAYLQALYRANGDSARGLPYDLFADRGQHIQRDVERVIEREGAAPRLGSVNKQSWRLAVLRSGSQAAWIKYDTGRRHGHLDGLNLGLFAKGLDLMPDFGYPPVHRGGWGGPYFDWYIGTLSHNTVAVDGRHQARDADGRTTLWADADGFHAIQVAAPDMIGGTRYERLIALITLSERDSYLFDLFRVRGGRDHARFMHSQFARVTTQGLALQPWAGPADGPACAPGIDGPYASALMRHTQVDPAPAPGWSVDWDIEDRRHYLAPGADVHLRYTDFTAGAQALLSEAWVAVGGFNVNEEAWIPRLAVRRVAGGGDGEEEVLESTFAGIVEAYEGHSNLGAVRRLPLDEAGRQVAIEVPLADGRRDIIIALDAEAGNLHDPALQSRLRQACGFSFTGNLCWLRRDIGGHIEHIQAHGGLLEV